MSIKEYDVLDTPTGWDDIQIEYVGKLVDSLGIQHFFETGAHLGQTSLYFYKRGLTVHTSEINPSYFEKSLERFKWMDIELLKVDSREHLRWFINRGINNVLYYLDAHWDGPCPLGEELYQITKLDQFLIVVHDVKVPNKPEFHSERDVVKAWDRCVVDDMFPFGTTLIYPNYTINDGSYLSGYCILSGGYNRVFDDRFTFFQKERK